jgi:hypothetical protein
MYCCLAKAFPDQSVLEEGEIGHLDGMVIVDNLLKVLRHPLFPDFKKVNFFHQVCLCSSQQQQHNNLHANSHNVHVASDKDVDYAGPLLEPSCGAELVVGSNITGQID